MLKVLFFKIWSYEHFYETNQDENIVQDEEHDEHHEIWRPWFKGDSVGVLIKSRSCFLNILKSFY